MVWPVTTERGAAGDLRIGGVSLVEIADSFGTPTYVYDELTLRTQARRFRDAFAAAYPESRVVYAGKALLVTALLPLLRDEGLGLDVVSGGELFIGLRGGMPAGKISFHGNNKSRQELHEAIDAGTGKIVIDNDHEIDLLEELTADQHEPQTVMLRLNPGVDVHTHQKISTGLADSKFGLPIRDGQAERAVARLVSIPSLNLVGYHAHVGSQLFDPQASLDSIDELLAFAAEMRKRYDVEPRHLSPGGGFGIAYEETDQPLAPEQWATTLSEAVRRGCQRHGLDDLPILTVEPGRAIAGPASVALYRVGTRKELPGLRTYVSVDGGMADNIRPALYGARYTAAIANRIATGEPETVAIAGKFCESGDLLIEHITLPTLRPDDLLAIPAAGAYCLAMASNYNAAPRPAVVMVRDGAARLIRRRETYDDLIRFDVAASDAETDLTDGRAVAF